MRTVRVEDAVGLTLCHDLTEIIPGEKKGTAFRRGHVVRREDIEHLLRIGKETLFVWDEDMRGQVHEDDAARRIALAASGEGVLFGEPKEGRINFTAARQGLLRINLELLDELNSIPQVTMATIHSLQGVHKGRTLAGTRVIPLTVPERTVRAVEEACERAGAALLRVLPFASQRVGLVITGSEVYKGRIKDGFGPVLREKFAAMGSDIHCQEIVPDDTREVAAAIERALDAGATMICVSGGMSVDPDDTTPASIRSVGCEIVAYGVPVYPGAMFMLGYKDDVAVMGLPGCVMYHRASILDLLLPRMLAGYRISARDIIRLGHGGLCEGCGECRFPQCSFGK